MDIRCLYTRKLVEWTFFSGGRRIKVVNLMLAITIIVKLH
jgi:hypothetical protein